MCIFIPLVICENCKFLIENNFLFLKWHPWTSFSWNSYLETLLVSSKFSPNPVNSYTTQSLNMNHNFSGPLWRKRQSWAQIIPGIFQVHHTASSRTFSWLGTGFRRRRQHRTAYPESSFLAGRMGACHHLLASASSKFKFRWQNCRNSKTKSGKKGFICFISHYTQTMPINKNSTAMKSHTTLRGFEHRFNGWEAHAMTIRSHW